MTFNYPVGSLTEYYNFDIKNAEMVLHDLQQMQTKVLSEVEIDIFEDDTSLIQVAV